MRIFVAFLAATLLTAVAGTVAQTQFVLATLMAVGAPVGLADRLSMTGADLLGFAPLYAGLIAAGFLVAFTVAGLLRRRVAVPRGPLFAVAGAVCIGVILYLMREVFFGIPLIAGTRTTAGVLAQIACGALGGAVFAGLSAPRR